jgi:hypothetical protein
MGSRKVKSTKEDGGTQFTYRTSRDLLTRRIGGLRPPKRVTHLATDTSTTQGQQYHDQSS